MNGYSDIIAMIISIEMIIKLRKGGKVLRGFSFVSALPLPLLGKRVLKQRGRKLARNCIFEIRIRTILQ